MLSKKLRRMVEDRVGLARAIAHQEWKKLSGYDRDEVTSWAFHGLVSAAERWPAYCKENEFEPYEGDAQSWFDTYATRRIRGSIIDELRAGDVATRRERKTIKEILAKGVDLSASWDVESPETIAAKTGLPVEDVRRAVSALVRVPVPMDDADGEPLELTSEVSVETDAAEVSLCRTFASAVAELAPLARRVLVLAIYKGMSDVDILDELPEITEDVVMSAHALLWVSALREQAVSEVLLAMRCALSPSAEPLPAPVRAPAPPPKRRRSSRAVSEPVGALPLTALLAS